MAEDLCGEGALARADLDQIAAAGGGEGISGSAGDRPGGEVRQHRGGGEIAASADAADPAGVVTADRVMQRTVHEIVEAHGGWVVGDQ